MIGDAKGPLMNSGHPQHAEAVQRYHKLIAAL